MVSDASLYNVECSSRRISRSLNVLVASVLCWLEPTWEPVMSVDFVNLQLRNHCRAVSVQLIKSLQDDKKTYPFLSGLGQTQCWRHPTR